MTTLEARLDRADTNLYTALSACRDCMGELAPLAINGTCPKMTPAAMAAVGQLSAMQDVLLKMRAEFKGLANGDGK